LPSFQSEQFEAAQCIDPEFPSGYLHVVHSAIGDYICLDLSSAKSNGDARVLLVSYETDETDREWGTIAEFLEELLTSAETDED
jgi:hypothetical protein